MFVFAALLQYEEISMCGQLSNGVKISGPA